MIKYATNAYLYLTGPVSFPVTQQTPVFTSKDDNSFGDEISGSTGNPFNAAAQALWVYYVTSNVEIKNARIRWAQRGVQFDANPGVVVAHSLKDTLIEKSQTGIYMTLPNGSLTLSNVRAALVSTATSGSGTLSGSVSNATPSRWRH